MYLASEVASLAVFLSLLFLPVILLLIALCLWFSCSETAAVDLPLPLMFKFILGVASGCKFLGVPLAGLFNSHGDLQMLLLFSDVLWNRVSLLLIILMFACQETWDKFTVESSQKFDVLVLRSCFHTYT